LSGGYQRVRHHARSWSAEEDNLIRTHYSEHGAAIIAAKLGLRPSLIRNRARWIGVSTTTTTRTKCRVMGQVKISQAQTQHAKLNSSMPRHVRTHEAFSLSWYKAQQIAFAEAMKNNPTERPS
jgi:hypothetical protein